MNRRNINLLVFVLAIVAVTALYFLLIFRPQSNKIQDARDRADSEEQRVRQLELELNRLLALQKDAPALREQAAKFESAMPSDPRLADFILQVQEAANASGIEWVSVSPTPPVAGTVTTVSNITMQMAVNGGYFQVQDFIVRLENLKRAVKVNTLNLGAGPGGLPNLTATLGMQMYVSTPAATTATPPTAQSAPAT